VSNIHSACLLLLLLLPLLLLLAAPTACQQQLESADHLQCSAQRLQRVVS
jgi:hypothetical protein